MWFSRLKDDNFMLMYRISFGIYLHIFCCYKNLFTEIRYTYQKDRQINQLRNKLVIKLSLCFIYGACWICLHYHVYWMTLFYTNRCTIDIKIELQNIIHQNHVVYCQCKSPKGFLLRCILFLWQSECHFSFC